MITIVVFWCCRDGDLDEKRLLEIDICIFDEFVKNQECVDGHRFIEPSDAELKDLQGHCATVKQGRSIKLVSKQKTDIVDGS